MNDTEKVPRDSSWPARLAGMNVYYAQQEYKQETGAYATEMKQLTRLLNQAIVSPFDIEIQSVKESTLDCKTRTLNLLSWSREIQMEQS